MLSSTSNFKSVACALLVACVLSGGWEIFLRGRGSTPVPIDDLNRWAMVRTSLRAHDPEEVVIIGTSRAVLDVDLDAFAEGFGRRPLQLAISAANVTPVMRDLCEDERFVGTLVVDVLDWDYYYGSTFSGGAAQPYVDWAQRHGELASLEVRMRVALSERLVILLPWNSPMAVLNRVLSPQPADQSVAYVFNADRSASLDFTHANAERLRDGILKLMPTDISPVPPGELWAKTLATNRRLVDRLRARGGEVVFVTFPINGKIKQSITSRFPRAEYWDSLTKGMKAVHYEDYPDLRSFTCPDDSHLTASDRRPFTLALTRALRSSLGSGSRPQ